MEDHEFTKLVYDELKNLSQNTKEGFQETRKGFARTDEKLDSLSQRTTRLEERGKLSSRLMLGISGALVVVGITLRAVL